MDRRTAARRSLLVLGIAWAVLFSAFVAWFFANGRSFSNTWLLPFGCTAVGFGVHLIYFRREDSEFFSHARAQWGLETASQSPAAMVSYGILVVLLGSLFIYGGLQSIGR